MVPVGVIRPILPYPVNHRLPSGPAAIPLGLPATPMVVGRGYSVMTPSGVIRPILSPADSVNQADSVNHRLPSGPAAIPCGLLPAVGRGYSVMTPAGVIRPIAPPRGSGEPP